MAGAIKVVYPAFSVVYSTPARGRGGGFRSTHCELARADRICKLLIRAGTTASRLGPVTASVFVFSHFEAAPRGEADVASETAFLAIGQQRHSGGRAGAAAYGALIYLGCLPEGRRPAVLFRMRRTPSDAGSSAADARANGGTLARIHDAARGFAASHNAATGSTSTSTARPLSWILSLKGLKRPFAPGWSIWQRDCSLAWLSGTDFLDTLPRRCHATMPTLRCREPTPDRPVFFDFDESVPGYLAHDIAGLSPQLCDVRAKASNASWHAFMEGYRRSATCRSGF